MKDANRNQKIHTEISCLVIFATRLYVNALTHHKRFYHNFPNSFDLLGMKEKRKSLEKLLLIEKQPHGDKTKNAKSLFVVPLLAEKAKWRRNIDIEEWSSGLAKNHKLHCDSRKA